jgi:hypothetical protein
MCESGCGCQPVTVSTREVVTTREDLNMALRDAIAYMDYDLYKSLDTPEDGEDGMTFAEVLERFVKNLEAK